MNLCLVGEGITEKKIYKSWIPLLCSNLVWVASLNQIENNNFTIIGNAAQGLGGVKGTVIQILEEIKKENIKIDYFFVCVDAENEPVMKVKNEIKTYIEQAQLDIDFPIYIIIQNKCIENWLMGNRKINIENAGNPELIEYREHYNVNELDPEKLTVPSNDNRSIGIFSKDYLKLMFLHKNMRYSETRPKYVCNQNYLEQLKKRYIETNHIGTFGEFYKLLEAIA